MLPPVLLQMHKAMDENVPEEQQNARVERRKRRKPIRFAMPDVQERLPGDSNDADEGSEIQKKKITKD